MSTHSLQLQRSMYDGDACHIFYSYATVRFTCGYRFKNIKMCSYQVNDSIHIIFHIIGTGKMYRSLANLIYSIVEEVDFNVSYIDLLMNSGSERVISFSWNQLNVSQAGRRCVLVPNHFTILSSSCGICHNNNKLNAITNQKSINCTDVPADAERCLFVLIPTICGGPAYQSSTFVNIDLRPKKGN